MVDCFCYGIELKGKYMPFLIKGMLIAVQLNKTL